LRPIQTRFRYGSAPEVLNLAIKDNSPAHYAKGTQSAITTEVVIGLLQLVSVWFQVLFTPRVGVLFIFQSPYWFTIGHRVVLSLGEWAPLLRTEFHELHATLVRHAKVKLWSTGLSPSMV
jgi:hypothetical protein